MSKSSKIKALLALNKIKNVDYSRALGLARPQALTTKYNRESFTANDLIKLATLTKTKLCYVDKDNNIIISFDESDF